MDSNEIIRKIAEKLSLDPELLKTVGDLTLSSEKCKIAEEQTPDTMYVVFNFHGFDFLNGTTDITGYFNKL